MKSRIVTALFVLALSTGASSAQDIFDGWYWNPNESGWGMNIEVQGETMFIAIFSYQQSGSPIWYFGSGHFGYDNPVFVTDMNVASSGACYLCPYTTPRFDLGGGGHLRIDFDTPSGIQVTWKGRTTNVQRQYWAFGSRNDFLFGVWAMVRGIDVPFGDYYYLNQRQRDGTSGDEYVAGQALGNSTTVAQWFSDFSSYSMLDRKSTADWYYEFVMTKELMVGHYWILDPGQDPVGTGTDFVAFRIGQQDIPKSAAALGALQKLERDHTKINGTKIRPGRIARHQLLLNRMK